MSILIQASFFEFRDPALAPAPMAHEVPLPVLAGDPLSFQARYSMVDDTPLLSPTVQLGLATFTEAEGFNLTASDVLPITVEPASLRIKVNPSGSSPVAFPAMAEGVYYPVLHDGPTILAHADPIDVRSTADFTLEVRYRNAQSGLLFDYADGTYLQRLRLPARLDRPFYDTYDRFYTGAQPADFPIYSRIRKYYRFETDYLNARQVEALQVALKHDTFELFDVPAQLWTPLIVDGPLTTNWADSVYIRKTKVTADLLQVGFSLLPGDLEPEPADYNADYNADYIT